VGVVGGGLAVAPKSAVSRLAVVGGATLAVFVVLAVAGLLLAPSDATGGAVEGLSVGFAGSVVAAVAGSVVAAVAGSVVAAVAGSVVAAVAGASDGGLSKGSIVYKSPMLATTKRSSKHPSA